MKNFSNRRARGLLLVALICCISLYIVKQRRNTATASISHQPPPDYDTHGLVPGNVENARTDLKRIYQSIQIFYKQHSRYPQDPFDLINAAARDPQAYGFSRGKDAIEMFHNPDTKYSDNYFSRNNPDKVLSYQMQSKRYDGTALGSAKAPGTRDVLAWTEIYAHANSTAEKNKEGKEVGRNIHPVGYYMVLWDDGSIEQVPYDKQLLAPVGKNDWHLAFPGQAGLPSDTLTYEAYIKG